MHPAEISTLLAAEKLCLMEGARINSLNSQETTAFG
jgi:hypothetical protein